MYLLVYLSSMVIRDLTLRSAASFGSFHLIRLLFDEYMFYLVEHKVASSTGKTAIAIMSEVSCYVIKHVHTLVHGCVHTHGKQMDTVNTYRVYNLHLCSFLGLHQVQ